LLEHRKYAGMPTGARQKKSFWDGPNSCSTDFPSWPWKLTHTYTYSGTVERKESGFKF